MMSEPVSVYPIVMGKFPIGIKLPEAREIERIVGGIVSQACAKVIYCISLIFTVNSQFPAFRVPVYTVDHVAKTPSLSMRRYIGLPAPTGKAATGYAIFIFPISQFFS